MRKFSRIIRLIHINLVLARHGLDNIILSIRLFRPVRFLVYFNPWNWFRPTEFNAGAAIRHALEDLGPIFVKFGQALSTRRDLMPVDVADELALLQDKVPPFSGEKAKKIIEREFKQSVDDLFLEFSVTPLASASIAQVHAAKLHDGTDVVVKILRPNMLKTIRHDLDLMYAIASLAENYWADGKRLHPMDVVAEFERNIIDELDFMREAANASQLRRNFQPSKLLYVPEVYWDYCRENIMVMERIHGIPIANVEQLRKHNVDIKKLAERGVEIFFTQVFRDCFFHADMHPGNIFVSYENPKDPKYICVDFGIMGSLSENDKRYLAENFLAFFNRDYRLVAELHVDSGWVAPTTRVEEFEGAIRTVCEPIFERPLSDISIAKLLMRLFQTGRRFNMEVQPQLVLLQKTLLAIEGLGRTLYPDLDLWSTAKPFLEKWIKEQVGPRALMRKTVKNAPFWAEQLPEIPGLLYESLVFAKQKRLHEAAELRSAINGQATKHKRNKRRTFSIGLGFALVITGGLNLAIIKKLFTVTNWQYLSGGLLTVGLLVLLMAWMAKE